MTSLELRYFTPAEFERRGRNWYEDMSVALMEGVDVLRHYHGHPIHISPHGGALGRPGSGSRDHDPQENGGEVRGMDVFPDGLHTAEDVQAFVKLAEEVGLTAIGVYPHWVSGSGKVRPGLHLGWRPDRADNPARWGMIRYEPQGPQRMVGMDQAVSLVGTEHA